MVCHVCWLASNWILVHVRNSHKTAFRNTSFRAWAHRDCKEGSLLRSQSLYFPSIFHRLVPNRGPRRGNLSSQILKLRQPWTAAAPRPRCIRKLSEKGRHAVCQSFSYIRVHHGLHLHLIKPPELALSYKPWLLFQTQLADNQVVIRRQLCTPFDTNVQHWLKQVSENDTEINEWLLTQRISVPGVLVYFCVGRKYSSEMSGLSHFCDPDPVLIF